MKNFKFNWGHGVALALGCFMIFILRFLIIADEHGDLISDQYYEDSLVFQEENIDARNRTAALEAKPEIKVQANGVFLQFPEKMTVDSGQIYMMKGAFKADDIVAPIKLNQSQNMLVPSNKIADGEYDITLTWYMQGKPYLMKKTIQWNMQ